MLLRYSDKKGYHEHIMITGLVKKQVALNIVIKFIAMLIRVIEMVIKLNYNSLDEFFEATNKWNQSINIYYLA